MFDLDDPLDIDLLLNKCFMCEDEHQLIQVAREVYQEKNPEDALLLLVYFLKRRAGNVSVYDGPATPNSRQVRVGLPWTYAEEIVVLYAFKVLASRHKIKPTEKTVATLLQRTEAEIHEKRFIKHGIRGLDLW